MIIHRHEIPYPPNDQQFTLPIYDDADIIHIGTKGDGSPHLWEAHDETLVRPAVAPARMFRIVATGQAWKAWEGRYVGTFIDASYVWHVLEETS